MPRRIWIEGADAIVRGALYAGCDFFAGYPITPATPILLRMMEELPRRGGIALQGEDEIASIAMCIAAAMAGRKAMTATSGPGMSLYSENIGLAIMGEVPLVVVDVQRLGPATGGATTGAQGDVQFVHWLTAGGIPLVVLCPGSAAHLYELTVHAFNVAERLRVPVVLLTSKDMVLSRHTLDAEAFRDLPLERRPWHRGPGEFVPYRFERLEDVPEFLPIGAAVPVRFSTSMHDERGYLTKDPEKVERKVRHLAAKIRAHADFIERSELDLQEGAETLIVAYGINAVLAREVVKRVRNEAGAVSLCVVESLFPIPAATLRKCMAGARRVVLPELNLGLYAGAIRCLLPEEVEMVSLTRVDGEPFTVEELLDRGGLR